MVLQNSMKALQTELPFRAWQQALPKLHPLGVSEDDF